MSQRKPLLRCYVVSFFFIAVLLLFIARLICIHLYQSDDLNKLALKQHNLYLTIPPQRGVIYDYNGKPLAVNVRRYSLFAVPDEVKDVEEVSVLLRDLLDLDPTFVQKRLASRKQFVWLKRMISDQQAQFIRDVDIDGLFLRKESRRSYPNGPLAAHILGFTDIDNRGLEGIELACNKELEGQPGYSIFVRDAHQSLLRLQDADKLPVDGYDLVLTVDTVIQYIVEEALDKAFVKFHPMGASVVVLDTATGGILALANRPTFDPNDPQGFPQEARRNRAICDFFEPGSVFKVVTATAALEEKKFKEEDRIFCENGEYRIANHTLHDHRPHGWLTFTEVVQQSSNIGFAKIAQEMGLPIILRYAKLFGFGVTTNLKLPGESAGILKPLNAYSKTSIGAVPMGQEVAVTALQLASAIATVANGGLYFRPYVIKEIKDKYDETIQEFRPQCLRRVMSFETSQRLTHILKGVVEVGTARLAKSDIYSFAGKTGTAQKVDPHGGYSHTNFVASFIGFAPVENPRIAVAVVFDDPYPYYGGVVAAPVFKVIAEQVLKYIAINDRLNEAMHADVMAAAQ